MKRNLNRTFDSWTASIKATNSSIKLQALFVLAWFHAVVQERRNYVPQGWLKQHEFHESDLKAAADILEQIIEVDDASGLAFCVSFFLLHFYVQNQIEYRQLLITELDETFEPDRLPPNKRK